MKSTQTIVIVLVLLVLVGFSTYWFMSRPSNPQAGNENTNITNPNANIVRSAIAPIPSFGQLGEPTSTSPIDSEASAGGFWNTPAGSIQYQVFPADGRSLIVQAQGKKSPAEDTIQESSMVVNGYQAVRIVGSVDFTVYRTFVIVQGHLYEFYIQDPEDSKELRDKYEQALSQLTFTE